MLQEVIDLRMFQEIALRKVFRDYDVDKNARTKKIKDEKERDDIEILLLGLVYTRPPTILE